jgi:hypothetical protein
MKRRRYEGMIIVAIYAPMITAGQILLEQTVGKNLSPHPTDF